MKRVSMFKDPLYRKKFFNNFISMMILVIVLEPLEGLFEYFHAVKFGCIEKTMFTFILESFEWRDLLIWPIFAAMMAYFYSDLDTLFSVGDINEEELKKRAWKRSKYLLLIAGIALVTIVCFYFFFNPC